MLRLSDANEELPVKVEAAVAIQNLMAQQEKRIVFSFLFCFFDNFKL